MPRQARQTGEYLHIIVRGNGKQILFEDDADRKKYLSLLQKYSAETGIIILAYCLMDNHVHLLIRDAAGAASVFMKKTGVSYVLYYNTKYERTGHLFQDRYKSEVIDSDAYLLAVYRYILNNPAKAGICAAEKYLWSSYREYGKTEGLTDTGMLREMIGDKATLSGFLGSRMMKFTWILILRKSATAGQLLSCVPRLALPMARNFSNLPEMTVTRLWLR